MSEKHLQFSILEYLETLKSSLNEDDRESLVIAQECLANLFGLNLSSETDKTAYSIAPLNLKLVLESALAMV